jgi:hypothetical protein
MSKYLFSFKLLLVLFFVSLYSASAQKASILIDSNSPTFSVVNLNDTMIHLPNPFTYKIDLDQNNIPDLIFSLRIDAGTISMLSTEVQAGDGCTFSINRKGEEYYVLLYHDSTLNQIRIANIFNPNDTLYSDSCYTSSTTPFARWIQYSGSKNIQLYAKEWISGVHYLGIKKIFNQKEYLGWVKLDVTSYSEIIFKEYAIQTLPIGIDEEEDKQVVIYPNPVRDQLTIKDVLCTKAEIANVNGSVILSQENINNDLLFSLDVHSLRPGIYFLKMKEADKDWYSVRRFVKQ